MWKPWFLSRSPGTQLKLSEVFPGMMVTLVGGTVGGGWGWVEAG